jgi:hypothetical protein
VFKPEAIRDDEVAGRKQFLQRAFQALAQNKIEGDYAEFGCYGAMTFRLAYGASRLSGVHVHLWGFDSFAGLPAPVDERDSHPRWIQGAMAISEFDFDELCASAGMSREDYTTVAGQYSETLSPDSMAPRPDQIALAYVDCDLHSSTTDVLRFLLPRLQHGMVLAFDDYYCFGPNAASGERLAVAEAFAHNREWRLVPYIQFGWHGMSFMVESRSLVPEGAS